MTFQAGHSKARTRHRAGNQIQTLPSFGPITVVVVEAVGVLRPRAQETLVQEHRTPQPETLEILVLVPKVTRMEMIRRAEPQSSWVPFSVDWLQLP